MSQHGKPGSTSALDHDPSDPPPAYTAGSYAEASSSSSTSPAGHPLPYTSLAGLTHGISRVLATNHDSQVTSQSREDGEILHCMMTQAADFLADVSAWLSSSVKAAAGTSARSLEAELYLTPEAAFSGSGWHSSWTNDRARQGVHVREARIRLPKQEKTALGASMEVWDDQKPPSSGFVESGSSYDFVDETTRGRLWWDNEPQAHRLARCLAAEINGPEDLSRREVRRAVKNAQSSKKREESISSPVADRVRTTARAEQMTFRRENEMGLWESQSGWTIILTVKVVS